MILPLWWRQQGLMGDDLEPEDYAAACVIIADAIAAGKK